MKLKLLSVFGILCLSLSPRVFAADPSAAQLIRQLPAISEVIIWEHQIDAINARPLGTPERIALVEPLNKKLQEVEKIYKALARLISAGESVYDYPGLLAAGRIYHNPSTDTYELGLGTPYGYLDVNDYKEYCVFIFTFDRTGRISDKRALEPEL